MQPANPKPIQSPWARLVRGLGRLHLLIAALPLLYLGTFLMHAAGTSFQAVPELYAIKPYNPGQVLLYLRRLWKQPQEKTVAVWGLVDNPETDSLGENSPSIEVLKELSNLGMTFRICSPLSEQVIALLGDVQTFDDPLEAAQGAHSIMVMGQAERYQKVDLLETAQRMRGQLFLDFTRLIPGYPVDQAGLHFLPYGSAQGPPWIDPDLLLYAEHLRNKIPPHESVLLLPVVSPTTVAGRARWYLHLNYQLFPRKLYIRQPAGASGTSVQYREWIQEYRTGIPWRKTRRYDPPQADFSQVRGTGSLRSLLPNEKRAIAEFGIEWVTFFSMSTDFRLQDWETIPASAALRGPQ
jgi:UDP-glucose/GDP-mannose dehydrogenase family protein